MRLRPHTLLPATLALAACAYFNGLYNANRLAGDARKAEREGRVGEARSLWSQAAIKAESVAVRYPESRYHDDALLLWGRALRGVGRCADGIEPLDHAVRASPSAAVRRQARVLLGECLVRTRQPDSAVAVLEPVIADAASPEATSAALWFGRAQLALGAPERAVEVLDAAEPNEAAFDLALAFRALGNAAAAESVLTARVAGPFDAPAWMAALDSLAKTIPEGAGRLVDRLVARRGVSAGARARLLVADGARWTSRGHLQAARGRFEAARAAAPDSVEGAVASVRLVELDLRLARDFDALPPLLVHFEEANRAGGTPARIAGSHLGLLRTAILLHDAEDVPGGEFRLFLLAEAFRDTANAPAMAATVLMEVQRQHPGSLFAPKALLAAALLDSTRAGEVRSLLLQEYPESPYTVVAFGRADDGFAVLEDSLRIALAAVRGQAIAPVGVEADDLETLRRRRP